MKRGRIMAAVLSASMLAALMPSVPAGASLSKTGVKVNESVIPDSMAGKISYSDTYDPIKWIKPGTDGRNGSGNDPWRNGLVTGNGENGLLEDGAPESGVLIFQNIQFNFPSNDQRETPELASVMDEVKQTLVNGGSPSSASSNTATKLLTKRAGDWSNNNGFTSGSWKLKNTYTFHPGMQLRLDMNGLENGGETGFYRYTNYETAEIGSVWTDSNGTWERKSFSSREDNATITSVKAADGNTEFSIDLSIDDLSDMASENKMSGLLDDLRYKKFYKNADGELYIGSVTHYPNYANSELKNGGFAGVSKIIAKGENAFVSVINGGAPTDDRTDEQISSGVPDETVVNVSGSSTGTNYTFNADPTISVTNAEEIILITKSVRDKNMCAYGEFADMTSYSIVDSLVSDTKAVAEKYTVSGSFDYSAALAPHEAKHKGIFNRTKIDFNADAADRKLTNEQLIAKAKAEGGEGTLNKAMLERTYYNGRYANICCSGYQVPRLGGMWTGAWKVEWSGDYTTDANINLQVAGNNIASMPESSQGFINFILRTVTDWQINAKQLYGIDNALFAPTRIDGDRAMVVHFNESFPGHIWNSGASWLLLPVYEYWQCCGNQQIPVAADVKEMLKVTDNTYNMSTQWYSESETAKTDSTVYNLRSTLGLTDARAQEIIDSGYFDLEKDILFPLLTKTCNFYTGLLTPEYYTKDGKAYYEAGKSELGEGETYLFAPSYSPENRPNGYGTNSYIQLNAVMDISAARDCFDMAKTIAGKTGEQISGNTLTADINTWTAYEQKLPPYLYEPTGELKEWAISDYGETYGHRHISQLYGLWPGYEANNDKTLFNAAKTLIETKNTYPSTDNVAGHSWMHKGLIMARAKSGEGVRDALLPTFSQEMHYNSMMTAHNTSGNQAYCTDTTITTPAILTESLLYSDSNSIEVLPALLPELAAGGSITGLYTRTGDKVNSITWNENSVTVELNMSGTANVKCGRAFKSATVDGVPAEVKADAMGDPYIEAAAGVQTVVFTFADIDNGTYTISASGENLVPETSIDGSAVKVTTESDSKTRWNLKRTADGTYTIENAYHGRYLANNGTDVYMKRTAADGDSIYWTINESGYLVSSNGKYLYLDSGTFKLGENTSGAAFTLTAESETITEYSADSITISADADLSNSINPGTRVSFSGKSVPDAAERKPLVWKVSAKDGTELSKTSITDGVLKIGADTVSKTLVVSAASEDGACVSNELEVQVSDIVQGEMDITTAEDVFVSGWSADKDKNYSGENYLVTTTAGNDKKYTLLKFNIPELGDEVDEILSSELVLTYQAQNEPTEAVYSAYKFTNEWSADSVTWNTINGDSYGKGTAIAEGVYNADTKQMVFELPYDYIKSNAGSAVSLLIDSDGKNGRTYWNASEAGESTAPKINVIYKVNTSAAVKYGPYWAADVTDNRGTSGTAADFDFGSFKNTDDTIKLFFPNAADGETIGSKTRISGIDGTSGVWNGNVTKTINANTAGTYTVYVLGNTNATDRLLEITNITTGASAQTELSQNVTEYSTSNNLKIFTAETELAAGENEIKIQAPSGKSAPNFIGLLLKSETAADPLPSPTEDPITPIPTETPLPDGFSLLDRTGWSAETNSQQATSGGNSVGCVLDGDSSTIWHSKWGDASKAFNPDENPVYLTVNMGSKQSVSGIRYTPRIKNETAGSINGVITAYEVYVSDDNSTWTKVGEGNMGYTKDDAENAVKDIIFAPAQCQYVKLVVKDNLDNGGAYVGSCAEFDMYTYSGADADHPITSERAKLDELVTTLNTLADSDIKTQLLTKAQSLKTVGTVDGIETFLSTANMLTDALGWISQGMDDVYIQRITDMLTENNMSAASVKKANEELSGFYTLGSDAKAKWEINCGEEYTISGEELTQPLYTRVINAIARAKAKIDSNDGKDYKMLKELVSYMTSQHNYTGYENTFGISADNCEIIVSNINFALSNLAKIEAGTLKTELTTYNSGEMWLDTLGSKISAHGGQIIEREGTYYWYGEDNKISYPLTTGVSCYSSKDLKNWTYEGIAFKAFDDGTTEKRFTKEFLTDNILGTQGRIERPKVIYNEKNNNYVMWMHLEKDGGYGLSVMGVAVSDSPTGPFTWKWYGRPVCDEYVTNGSYHPFFRDMNLFADDDKQAYLFVSSENNQVMYAIRLNDDYTWIDADDLESSGSTEADITEGKVIIPDMTVSGGTGSYIGASYTYGLKSFTRYQLAAGGAAALTKKKDADGNEVKDDNGNQIYISSRADGLLCIPEYSDGRWARVGQNTAQENKTEGMTETIVNNSTTLQREAPAPIKIDGKYYLVTSGLSGWYANASLTQTADNILGPWTYTGNPMTGAGPENNGQWDKDANTASSFNSQSTCILKLPDGTYMYMGDRWKNGKYELPDHEGVKESTYIWLPVTFENDSTYGENTLKVRWHDSWSMGNIPMPAPEKPSKPSGEVQFDGTITTPEYVENTGDTYDIMREYTVDGQYAPYYNDISYNDKLTVELDEGTKYDIKVKEYAKNGTSTNRGIYFIFKDGNGSRINTANYLQDKVMTGGDSAETTLPDISGDEHSSVIVEMKIFSFNENSVLRVGISAVPTAYKVTAGEGVELIGISSGDYVSKDSTVKYVYNGTEYTSSPITAPTEITAPGAGDPGESPSPSPSTEPEPSESPSPSPSAEPEPSESSSPSPSAEPEPSESPSPNPSAEPEPSESPSPSPSTEPTEYSIKYDNGGAEVEVPEGGTYTVIFAAYDERGMLTSVKVISDVTFDKASRQTVTPENFNTTGAKTVKVMLWNSLKDMRPLCGADTANINQEQQ